MKSNWVRDHEHMFFNWGAEMSSDFFGDLVQFWLSHKPNYVCLLCVGKRSGPNTHYVENLHLRHTNSLWSRLAFSISSYLVYKVRSTAEPPSRFRVAEPTNRWSWLPGGRAFLRWSPDPLWSRMAEPTYDRSQHIETGRLTLTRELKPLFITQYYTTQDNTYTFYVAILWLTMTHLHTHTMAILPCYLGLKWHSKSWHLGEGWHPYLY